MSAMTKLFIELFLGLVIIAIVVYILFWVAITYLPMLLT
ncbi:putative membrane protein YqiK [Elusimicrobium simillimum]